MRNTLGRAKGACTRMPRVALPPNPLRAAIFPVFETDGSRLTRLLGTCFALHGDPVVIISASHVFEATDTSKICLLLRDSTGAIHPAVGSEWTVDHENDLAFVCPQELPPLIEALPLSADMVGVTDRVFSFEFSPTVPSRSENGLRFTPHAYTHVGNIVFHEYGKARDGTDIGCRFETSYPAFKGASGSPVMTVEHNAVLGVIVQNHSLPLEDGEGSVNFARAVSLEVLAEWLGSQGIRPTLQGASGDTWPT